MVVILHLFVGKPKPLPTEWFLCLATEGSPGHANVLQYVIVERVKISHPPVRPHSFPPEPQPIHDRAELDAVPRAAWF
jgi:hypothetical protein